jgi:tRNA-dihydrouridine synthase B
MQIGDLKLKGPLVAAPMAGVSSPAYRLMTRKGGADLVYTEMVSAKSLVMGQKKGFALARVLDAERPVAIQLFGGDPESMGRAAALIRDIPADLVDINMGCPVRKVRRQDAGSALLEDPERAAEITAAVVQNAGKPVTVKVRLGYSSERLEHILPGIIKAGPAAIILHARTTRQMFSGQADWSAITRLVSWCPLPVIGNGDVRSGRDAVRMLQETGCAGVMIGRAAMGDPWIFARAKARLAGKEPLQIGPHERREALYEHMELARQYGGEGHALHFVRKFMMWYTRGLPGAVSFRREAGPVRDLDTLWSLSTEYFQRLQDLEAA